MAIVRMKHLRLLGLEQDRKPLLEALQGLGCVQIDAQDIEGQEGKTKLRRSETALNEARSRYQAMQSALDVLTKHANLKESLLQRYTTPRPVSHFDNLQDPALLNEAAKIAADINQRAKNIADKTAEKIRLEGRLNALMPWSNLDIPLETPSTNRLAVQLGTLSATADMDACEQQLAEEAPESALFRAGQDSELHYLCLLCHPAALDSALGVLKNFGFSRMVFKDTEGTAAANISAIQKRLSGLETERTQESGEIADYALRADDLRLAADALSVVVQREEAAERLTTTGKVFCLEGWSPESKVGALEKLFARYDCAYEFRMPEPDEDVPVRLHNSRYIEPLNMVTNLYSLPRYSNIDPNPIMAIFYILFFGMMFADVAYGLVLLIVGLVVTRKGKPKGMTGHAFRLMQSCGLSTILFGFVFGGFFSDIITQIGLVYFDAEWAFPTLWVSPIDEPMYVLIFALIFGAIHLITGMVVKAYLLIRDNQPLAAVMETLPWWILFAFIGVTAVTGSPVWVVIGLILIVLTQGYTKKTLIGKLGGGLAGLYNITAYLSDILSYSRLMALGLAGGVIGSVFNQLGAMPGAMPIIGPILFLAIFLVGHTFNLGVNLIGTFVHAARLQYVEFFSKFYDEGGAPFSPLHAKTKYTDLSEVE